MKRCSQGCQQEQQELTSCEDIEVMSSLHCEMGYFKLGLYIDSIITKYIVHAYVHFFSRHLYIDADIN